MKQSIAANESRIYAKYASFLEVSGGLRSLTLNCKFAHRLSRSWGIVFSAPFCFRVIGIVKGKPNSNQLLTL